MKMLEPGYGIRSIAVRRRKPNTWFKRGTVFRSASDALRVAGRPLTIRVVVLAMLTAKGISDSSPQGHPRPGRGGSVVLAEPQRRQPCGTTKAAT
jgi:hypothetical protein